MKLLGRTNRLSIFLSILYFVGSFLFFYFAIRYRFWEVASISSLYDGLVGDIAKIIFYKITLAEESLISNGYKDRVPIITFMYISFFWINVITIIIYYIFKSPIKFHNNDKGNEKNTAIAISIFTLVFIIFYRDFDYDLSSRLGDRGHIYDAHLYWIIIYTGASFGLVTILFEQLYFYLKDVRDASVG